MRDTRVNPRIVVSRLSLAVQPHQFAREIDTDEVDRPNPFGLTIFPNRLQAKPGSADACGSCDFRPLVISSPAVTLTAPAQPASFRLRVSVTIHRDGARCLSQDTFWTRGNQVGLIFNSYACASDGSGSSGRFACVLSTPLGELTWRLSEKSLKPHDDVMKAEAQVAYQTANGC
jgi:hypothetical protein